MIHKRHLIPAIFFGMALVCLSARADVVVLKSGKKIQVEKVWQENGRIWIFIDGMRASVPQSQVARIESESAGSPGPVKPRKEPTANIKKMTRPTPREFPGRQANDAPRTASATNPAPKREDRDRIFPDGEFGDLRWGTKVYAIKGLKKIKATEGQEGVQEYGRENDNLKFGQAALSSIHYAFWRDRLYMLTIRTRGRSNYIALRREVFRQFDQGRRADQALERYLWTDAPNDMMLQYLKDDEQGVLWLRSGDIDRQYKLSQVNGHASYLKWMKSRE